jgi:hypothetical protein
MSITVKTLESSDYSQWDSFVDRSPQGDVFCYSWWLEAITKSHYKIIALFENNEIVAGMPLAFDDENFINQPPVTRTLGILYKPEDYLSRYRKASDQRKWQTALVEQLPLENFIQMCMHHNFTDWLPFRWKGFRQTTRYTYLLYYENKTLNDLWKNLNSDKKKKINRAMKNGVRIEVTDDFELLYRFESLSFERQGLKFRIPANDLKLLDDVIKKNGKRVIFKAIDHLNQVHAMLYVVFNTKSAYALMSGSDANLRKQGGHTLVTWEAIKFFRDKVQYYNFGGSDIRTIEEHVKGYGGVITPYFHIFNDRLLDKRTDIWYHFDQVIYHSKEILKDLLKRFLRKFR